MPSDTQGDPEVKGNNNDEVLQAKARSQLEQLLNLVRTQTSNTDKALLEVVIMSMISYILSAPTNELRHMLQAIESLEAVADAMTDNNGHTGSNPITLPGSEGGQDTKAELDSNKVDAATLILVAHLFKNLLDKNPELLQTITQEQDDSSQENNSISDLLKTLAVLDNLSAPKAEELTKKIESLSENRISELTAALEKIIKTPSASPKPEWAKAEAKVSEGSIKPH
tara:strand:- start:14365 stop:15042 length:678 start_codon:yes stop_codon:yes gene_type:complete